MQNFLPLILLKVIFFQICDCQCFLQYTYLNLGSLVSFCDNSIFAFLLRSLNSLFLRLETHIISCGFCMKGHYCVHCPVFSIFLLLPLFFLGVFPLLDTLPCPPPILFPYSYGNLRNIPGRRGGGGGVHTPNNGGLIAAKTWYPRDKEKKISCTW